MPDPAKKAPTKQTASPRARADASSPAGGDASPRPGALVEHSYFDHYSGAGGQETVAKAIVVDVDQEAGTARIVVLDNASGPIPLDQLKVL